MSPWWQRLFLVTFLTIFIPLYCSGSARGADTTTKAVKGDAVEGKKTGFAGDPSRKRGLEIGFDLGRKDGKTDQTQNLQPDPKRHEGFEKPEKYWRSEYGSRATFVGGFRSGYMGGYQSVFGKKIPLEPSLAGSSGSVTGSSGSVTKGSGSATRGSGSMAGGTGTRPKSTVNGPKQPTSSVSSDAL